MEDNNFPSTYNFHHTFPLNFKHTQKTLQLGKIIVLIQNEEQLSNLEISFQQFSYSQITFCYLFKIEDVN